MQSGSTSPRDFTVQSKPPRHVAIIMDGNGRWATRRGLPRLAGHRAGVAAVRRTVEHASLLGIECLTLYAFSSDNWRRPAEEVEGIFRLLRAYLRLESARLKEKGVRLEVIGRRDRLAPAVVREIERAESQTSGCRRLALRIAVDYSSREAILTAAASVAAGLGRATPELSHQTVTAVLTRGAGDVDLLIRTGGEKRLSDFLLWESAYAELYFTDRMWPEFDSNDLETAVHEFHRRERKFGGLPAPSAAPSPMLDAGGLQ